MNAPLIPVRFARAASSSLAARLRKELDAEVLFDRANRGRYSTDASIYQVEPIGIVVPRSEEAARAAIAIAAEEGVPLLPRGAGSSQCGQAIGAALVIDHSKYLNRILEVEGERAVVQPGIVLDALNVALRPKGLWFPVDVSTSAQATLGGMAGNNSCGSRSIAYGNMVHNVLAIEACTVEGERWRFGRLDEPGGPPAYRAFVAKLKALFEREKAEIEARFPKLLRKVAGYNLDHLGPPHANAAHLLVEFSGEDDQAPRLKQLVQLMADLGLAGSVVEVTDAKQQRDIWEVRKSGLNIMMSMKGDGKPVSFIEDCAVPLEHLAEYTDRLTRVFEKNGTRGTWYAHASVGTLHVRPILDMRRGGAEKMRAIAEEACAMVREYKGAYSGEHGDGLVRSEWIEPFFGPRLNAAFAEIKALFDPLNRMNPGKIVAPPRMDDPTLFRVGPGYRRSTLSPALDWAAWDVERDPLTGDESGPGTGGDPSNGLTKAIEMCNNNGHCRKFDAGTMCPSFRVTRDEQHTTRGRANTLRLALAGQLDREDLAGDAVHDALD